MAVDEPRHHDHASGIDHLGIPGIQVGADGGDPVAVDEHVAFGQVTDLGIEAEDRASLDQSAIRGHHVEVEAARIDLGNVHYRLDSAAEGKAAGSPEVALHQLL